MSRGNNNSNDYIETYRSKGCSPKEKQFENEDVTII
jgi:hypothetical protein